MLPLGFCVAGWSSPVARWAHNPKVAGSNPAPATNDTCKERSSESRRPLRLYGRAEHGGQIPSQFDLKRLSVLVRGQHDGVYEAAGTLRGFRPGLWLLKRARELGDLRATNPGHLRMEQRRRLGRSSLGAWARRSRRSSYNVPVVDRELIWKCSAMVCRGMKRPIRFVLFGALLVLPSPIHAQTPPRGEGNRDPHLRIDSPRDGAVVAPGETLHVTVSSPDRTRFDGLVVVMEDPIEGDYGAIPASLPARFAIKIPEDISPGLYTVSAMAGRTGGELVVAVIEVDIERRETPSAIRPRLQQFYFGKKGQTTSIELLGDFGNGDVVDVTKSSRVTFESSDAAVATVDTSGTVTAVGAGHAAVVAWYGPRDKGIKVSVPVEVR
jgi:hypothetical protein